MSGTLFRCYGVKRGHLLFHLLTAATGARNSPFLVFGKRQDFGEWLFAGLAKKIVMRHKHLPGNVAETF
jgi:hypothetical protein